MIRKRIIIPIAAVVMVSTALIGSGMVFAQSTNNSVSSLAQAIAQKFNLNQADVEQTINQYHGQKMQDMEDKRLSNLVSQGKITDAQKTSIENELDALKSKYNFGNGQNLTPDQKKQNMQNFTQEFQTWLNSQGIDPTILKFGHGMGGHGFEKWRKPSPSPTATPTAQ